MPLDLFADEQKKPLDLFAEQAQKTPSFLESLKSMPVIEEVGTNMVPTAAAPKAIAGELAPYSKVAGAIAGSARGVPGAALGYIIGGQAEPLLQAYSKGQPLPSITKQITQGIQDIPEAGVSAMLGPVAGKAVGAVVRGAGKLGKQVLGSLTGTGTGAIEEALKGTPKFRDALRGKITGEEIVENTRDALTLLKHQRGQSYQNDLASIAQTQTPINTDPLKNHTKQLIKNYVKVDRATGEPDWTRSALGEENSEGVKKVREIVEKVKDWGSKEGDNTAVGLDMLKRQLDDFYSDSSNARSFVANIRNKVKEVITQNVPEYSNMTKSYAEATKLIKDVESGLMMRKQGISGRIIADQTLRRLTSSMRDNFELRRELVNILGQQSGDDIAGQVAGHAMSQVIPRGITGSGLAVGGGIMASVINPKLWPVLLASSPRVSGEFLRVYGKGLSEIPGMSDAAAKFLSYVGASESSKKQSEKGVLIP